MRVAPLRERQVRHAVDAVDVAEASTGERAIETRGELAIADARRSDRVEAADGAAAAYPSAGSQRRERGAEAVAGHPDAASAERTQIRFERRPDRVERFQESAVDRAFAVPR